MSEIKEQLTNPETAAQFRHIGNWNRVIQIPGVWRGLVQDIPPNAVEALLKQGRKDFERILPVEESKPGGKNSKPATSQDTSNT